jgi:chorismate mutase/prephenate dehydrogenase
MPHENLYLKEVRSKIDEIDHQIIDLLKRRQLLAHEVLKTKIERKLPIFVPQREEEKVQHYRKLAEERGMDPTWAEDFLRMVMTASRDSQSIDKFPSSTDEPKVIVFVGGSGGMGKLYARFAAGSGHIVRILDKDDWPRAAAILRGADFVLVTVPIHVTEETIRRLGPLLEPQTVLSDFTSVKQLPMKAMLEAHTGPVVGLHPMHGPDVKNLSKQLMLISPGRNEEASAWLIRQLHLWGMRTKFVEPEKHDEAMHHVQGLRHFVALLQGSYMQAQNMRPADVLDFSSPIYRAELMMTGRIFAQDARLYAEIVFSNEDRRELLLDFLKHHETLADMVRRGDKEAFIKTFEEIAAFFGDFAPQALEESSYIINRLADRFADR